MIADLMDQQDPIVDSPSMQPQCTADSVGLSALEESHSQQHLESPSLLLMRPRETGPWKEGIQRRRLRSKLPLRNTGGTPRRTYGINTALKISISIRKIQHHVPTHRSRGQQGNLEPLPTLQIPLPNQQQDNVPVFLVPRKCHQK